MGRARAKAGKQIKIIDKILEATKWLHTVSWKHLQVLLVLFFCGHYGVMFNVSTKFNVNMRIKTLTLVEVLISMFPSHHPTSGSKNDLCEMHGWYLSKHRCMKTKMNVAGHPISLQIVFIVILNENIRKFCQIRLPSCLHIRIQHKIWFNCYKWIRILQNPEYKPPWI